jgi:hypothetical protein
MKKIFFGLLLTVCLVFTNFTSKAQDPGKCWLVIVALQLNDGSCIIGGTDCFVELIYVCDDE